MDVVREQYPDLQVIILTAYATLDSAITAVKTGAVDYLLKPQRIAQIEEAVQRALKRRLVQDQRQHLIDIIGDAMRTLQPEDVPSPKRAHEEKLSSPIEMNGMFFDPAQPKINHLPGNSNFNPNPLCEHRI